MVIGLASGCGDLTVGPTPSGGSNDEGTSGDSSASVSETLFPTTTSQPSTTTDGTTLIDESGSTSSDDSGGSFIAVTGSTCDQESPPGTEARCSMCDPWAQDCPDGEACRPWANDLGNAWNATRCSPLPADPDDVGEPCTIEDSPVSGLDSCVIDAMCWDVDAKTLEGECVPFCAGSESDPICDAPDHACMIANDGALSLCLPTCDPLAPSCDDGESCHPIDGTWFCLPDGAGIHGMATLCESGTTAVDPNQLASCDPTAGPCCTPICDPAAPACDPTLTCSPVGDTNAGVCVDP
jgi:hypothetical protein